MLLHGGLGDPRDVLDTMHREVSLFIILSESSELKSLHMAAIVILFARSSAYLHDIFLKRMELCSM